MNTPAMNSQASAEEARRYNGTQRWLDLGDLALKFGFLALLLATGWTNSIHALAQRVAGDRYALRLFIYVLFLSVISKVLSIGLDWYRFHIEHRFQLSNQRLSGWIKDEVKGWVLGLIIAALLSEIVYGLIRTSPERWWIYAWVIFAGLFVFFAQIAPVALFPLFYTFSPLQNEELKVRLMRLGERAGTRIRGVYEWNLSEKTRKANAALIGLGNTRRIILADTLLQNYTVDEIEAVMAHEMGHHVHGHIMKGIVVEAIVTLAGFYTASWVLEYSVHQRHMFEHLADFANLPLLVLVSSLLSMLLMPALHAFSRFAERQSDLYCWKSISSITPFVTAMEKLNAQNLGERSPSRLVEVLFYSHPAIAKRIAAAEAWARENRPSLAP
ncbi:MAG TPA: M48 family metallopeptidase [Candidatus Saccharimonadales bacterium]|jgi:STE24 endopeptidase|nr:M48 family metallopeptidase [Candidatus Saccharimonadales bacterium]